MLYDLFVENFQAVTLKIAKWQYIYSEKSIYIVPQILHWRKVL